MICWNFNQLLKLLSCFCKWNSLPVPKSYYHCQRFGHILANVSQNLKVFPGTYIKLPIKNVISPHIVITLSSKKCDRYISKQEIQSIRTKEYNSFLEAKQRVLIQHNKPRVSYSSLLNIRKYVPYQKRETTAMYPKIALTISLPHQFLPLTNRWTKLKLNENTSIWQYCHSNDEIMTLLNHRQRFNPWDLHAYLRLGYIWGHGLSKQFMNMGIRHSDHIVYQELEKPSDLCGSLPEHKPHLIWHYSLLKKRWQKSLRLSNP